jgi:hypothetical protein
VAHALERSIAGTIVDMAGPLYGQGLVRPSAGPERHGRRDRFEIEVIARIGQRLERQLRAVENLRLTRTGDAMNTFLRFG